MIAELIKLAIRHGLTAYGVQGVLTGDDISALVGAVATVIGLVWSASRKIQRARAGA